MEGRKARREKKVVNMDTTENKKVKKGIGKISLISKILMVVLTVLMIAVMGIVISLKVLPNKFLIPLCVLVFVVDLVGLFLVFRKKTGNKLKLTFAIIATILIVVFSFITSKLTKTLSFLGTMSTETVNSKTYSVLVLKDSEYNKIEDIAYRLLLYYDNEVDTTEKAIEKLNSVMTLVTEQTDDVHELANRLVGEEVDAILIEDSYYAIIEEGMKDFKDKTKVIYTFALEDTIQTIAKEVSVTKEPFNIFISGIDSYGKISAVSRSDVNMVASINPQTKQILLVNIPRDYYVQLHGTYGYRDKLTHAGIYGVDMSVKTVEDLFDIDINYYVRVNFSSLIDIIDAIGGVEVYSKYAFTSVIGGYHFVEGYNHLDGNKALGFARERYAFYEGDRMRGQNQQAVIQAMIKKVCSSKTILTRFDALLDSLEGSFQTNMDYKKIVELVRMQITDGAEWKVTSVGIDGCGSMERTYSMGKTLLSVLIPYAGSVNKAESMINSVLNGEELELGTIDLSSYNDYLVVPFGEYPEDTPKVEETEEPETEETVPGEDVENPETEVPGTGEGEGTEIPGTGNGEQTGDGTGTGTPTEPETPEVNTPNEGEGTGTIEPEPPSTGNTETDGGNTAPPATEETTPSAEPTEE